MTNSDAGCVTWNATIGAHVEAVPHHGSDPSSIEG